MAESYGDLCSDFYVNQRLNLKMDLPNSRETVLAMFDRLRREFPGMDRFRRFASELVLESDDADGQQRWCALRRNSVRSGVVNPAATDDAYALHKMILDTAPYFLSVSPLDVDYLELLFGFDLLAAGNHDAIVYEALLAGSPLGGLLDIRGATQVDCQPVFGVSLDDEGDVEAHFEIKTRSPGRAPSPRRGISDGKPGPGAPGGPGSAGDDDDLPPEPISVFLTMRRYGPVNDVGELPKRFKDLVRQAEQLLQSRVVPHLVVPIRDAIASSSS